MSDKELNELMEYNLEYLEALNSEDLFGGDYTSQVDLKYANKNIERLQQENEQLKEILNEIKNIDIFKEFSFPLMKRWEEQQVLSSIDYQFKNTFIRKINELEKGDING